MRERHPKRVFVLWFSCSTGILCCSRGERHVLPIVVPRDGEGSRHDELTDAAVRVSPTQTRHEAARVDERTISFSWKPRNAHANEYAMNSPEDQHRMTIMRGVVQGHAYPVVVAFHGQPRRGQAPRTYAFPNVVIEATRVLVQTGQVQPLVLVTPVFRFEGQNWPQFELAEFMGEVNRVLSQAGLTSSGTYVFGHSGAAGCGGGGLNGVAEASPKAVGFFDTCIGAGFVREAKALEQKRIPTLIMHSVETAGYRPRQPVEYDANFDFGKIYSAIGLHAAECPPRLPEVPLRQLVYRCATSSGATTQALVVDTGLGEKAHEALVPIAVRYFLREYLTRNSAIH